MSYKIEYVAIAALKPYPRNARTHSKRQIEQIAASIRQFGFVNPVLVSDDLTIIAGHGRVEAAKLIGMTHVPVIRLSHLDQTGVRAYIIADNRLAEMAGWDPEILAIELRDLIELEFEVELVGFAPAEIDLILSAAQEADPTAPAIAEDDAPPPPDVATTRPGDIWELGRHRLICGDALKPETYAALMAGETAVSVFTDPPYNVPIVGFAGGKGKAKRREFAMASGEMTAQAFEAFLKQALGNAASVIRDGAIVFVFIDWRHMGELLAAGKAVFDRLENVCVWSKSNGGMGSLYRSQHELIFVFRKGQAAHLNNVQLGRFGRNRTNVWDYAGVNAFGAARDAELAMHPTVKPVALIEDALKDVTRRGDIVLDPFAGSGSTLIAAHKCGRSARLIEIDPRYCDVIVNRFQHYAGKTARLAGSSMSFDELIEARMRPFA
jgi:DNA modification methylase